MLLGPMTLLTTTRLAVVVGAAVNAVLNANAFVPRRGKQADDISARAM